MLKKTLSVIALALSGCLLFASCSPQAQPSASSSANSTATAGATGSNEARADSARPACKLGACH